MLTCFIPGHWIQDCPQSGKVMLDADGNHVIVEPDKASWEKFEAKHKAAVAQQEAASSSTVSKELEERGLLCSIDRRLFVDPVKTPCCGKIYCHECIENTLLDSDLVCPNCSQPVLIDDLVTDEEMANKVREFEREKAAAKSAKSPKSPKEAKDNEKVDESADGYDDDQKNNEKSIQKPTDVSLRSPSPEATTPETTKSETSTASKKRPAEDDDTTDWSNVPKGPAAMRNQQQQSFPTPPQFPNPQFPMMPNFPMQAPFPMQPQFPFNNNNNNNNNNNFFPPGNMNNMNMMANTMTWPPAAPNMPPQGQMGQMPYGGQQPPSNNRFQQNNNNNNNNQQDDSAYIRQPVNPRHQHRTKRARPCDYTTLS